MPASVSSSFKPFGYDIKGGDATLAVKHKDGFLLAIIDVLGHSLEASSLASNIVNYKSNNLTTNLINLMHDLHATFRCSRGAAINLTYIDLKRQSCHSIGVGNTKTAIIGNIKWKGFSYKGIVGHRIPSTLAEQTTTFIPGDLILLWTDGLPSRQTLDRVDTIKFKTAEQITHQLIAELAKPFDDSGCLVFKWMN
jgi:Stage II sporulation protein E (SpoIIE)